MLRMIPKSSFKKKFPNKSYARFVGAALLRLALGYIFLINVLVILLKADSVLDIFYDVLALQFISELDDIAFSLCKLDVLGRRLQRACTQRLFQTEFEKQKFSKTKLASVLLKSVYVLNIAAFLTIMIIFSERQRNGYYQCSKIDVDFGDAVWAEALAEVSPGEFSERMLAVRFFLVLATTVWFVPVRPPNHVRVATTTCFSRTVFVFQRYLRNGKQLQGREARVRGEEEVRSRGIRLRGV